MLGNDVNMYILLDNLCASLYLGEKELVKAFFINVAYHLENNEWGSKYPTVMKKFYKGKLEKNELKQMIKELDEINKKFTEIKLEKLMWFDGDTIIPAPFEETPPQTALKNFFINNQETDIIDAIYYAIYLAQKNKKGIYVGDYHLNEVATQVSFLKRNKIIKITKTVTFYVLFALFIKLITTPESFDYFIKRYLFWSMIAIFIYMFTQIRYNNQRKKFDEKQKEIESDEPVLNINQITFKKDLLSSSFDYVIDELNCNKNFEGLKKELKLEEVKDWESDLKDIYNKNNYKTKYFDILKENLMECEFEMYILKNIDKIFNIGNKIYNKDNDYRIIKIKDAMFLFAIHKNKEKNEIKS